MRRVRVGAAPRRNRAKPGGRGRQDLSAVPAAVPDERLLAPADALTRLAAGAAVAARGGELRRFAGRGRERVAAAFGMSVYAARPKFFGFMQGEGAAAPAGA